MPPCQRVLMNKIKRTQSLTRMIKSSSNNLIQPPEAVDGYCLSENNMFAIEYFDGYPYPQSISDMMDENFDDEENNTTNNDSNEFDCEMSSSDEEYEGNIENGDWI